MEDALILLEYECEDETGRYITTVIADRKDNKTFVLHYLDFPEIVQICPETVKQGTIKNMIRTLFSQEGVIPRVKFYNQRMIDREEFA